MNEEFCGYCGRAMNLLDGYFCLDCEQHVLKTGPPEERTWYAQHGKSCPYYDEPQVEVGV